MYLDLAESAVVIDGEMLSQRITELLVREFGSDFVADYRILRQQHRTILQDRWDLDSSQTNKAFRESDFDLLSKMIPKYGGDNGSHCEKVCHQLAKIFGEAGRPKMASVLLKSLYENSQNLKGNQFGQALLLEGWISSLQKKWDLSHQKFSKAYNFFVEKKEHLGMATALMYLGKLAMNQWDTTSCIEYLKDAEKQLGDNSSEHLRQKIKSNQAMIQLIRGDAETASNLFETILADDTFENSREFYVSLQLNLAKSKIDLEDYDAVFDAVEKAMKVIKPDRQSERDGQLLLTFGEALVKIKQFGKAEHQISCGFSLLAKSGSVGGIGEAYRILGMLSRDQNYFGRSQKYFERGIEINAEINHLLNLCETYFEYSILARSQDDPVSERQYLERSLYYAEEIRAVPRIARLRNQLENLE